MRKKVTIEDLFDDRMEEVRKRVRPVQVSSPLLERIRQAARGMQTPKPPGLPKV